MPARSNLDQNSSNETESELINIENTAEEEEQVSKISRTTVSPEIRKRVISLAIEGNGCTMISRILDLPRTNISSIVSKFFKTGEAEPRSRGGNRRGKLTIEQKESICGWIDENCLLTLKDIKKRVQEELNLLVSESTIDRCLKSFHYTVKNILPIPVARNTERTIEARFLYAQEFRRLEQTTPLEYFFIFGQSWV